MQSGLDRLLQDQARLRHLRSRRVALVGHPASMTSSQLGFGHALDELVSRLGSCVTAAFGPQHGMRGDRQFNMDESVDYIDPKHGIPVFSLYGDVRRPRPEMLEAFDVVLVDLQDVGWRGYTYVATLLYMLEACAGSDREVWVLDRPNPAGREVEGRSLEVGHESFVGVLPIPQRPGLTLGELGRYMVEHFELDVQLEVVTMSEYDPNAGPGFGWPPSCVWVHPSPAIASLNAVRNYAGTVLLEGSRLSEGRGTTMPLEVFGAPGLRVEELVAEMRASAPEYLEGCFIRPCFFEPFFDKFQGELCAGAQIHAVFPEYDPVRFRPYRLISLLFKTLRKVEPKFEIWRTFHYEYEPDRRPIDVIHGGSSLRDWVDDESKTVDDWERLLRADEIAWVEAREPFLIYP